jgi:hypothetical protein
MSELHLFTDNTEFYIAESVEDAVAAWEELARDKRDPEEFGPFHQLDDDYVFRLSVEYEDFNMANSCYPQSAIIEQKDGYFAIAAPCRDWCSVNARGFFASTEN